MKPRPCIFCGGDGKAFSPEARAQGDGCTACGGDGIQKPITLADMAKKGELRPSDRDYIEQFFK